VAATLLHLTDRPYLTDRPVDAVLFRTPQRRVDAAGFLADATHVARSLPERGHVFNLCQDRYWFAVGLAAALLRRQVSLLSGNPSAGELARIAQDFPDAYALTDSARDQPDTQLERHRIGRDVGPSAAGPIPAIDPRQPAAIVLTSGTTGSPVGTRKCWGELVARSRAAGLRFALDEAAPAAIVGTVPPGHMYGLETTVLLPLHAAASVWCGPVFFPADIAAALDLLPGPRILVTTPLHLRALLRTAPPARPPERVISATAPLERALAEQAEADWGTQVLEIFGATEVGSIASRRTVSGDDWELYPDVAMVDAEVPNPNTGGACQITAPWAEPRPLGDRVERTPDGRHFRLVGRVGDLVKLGGHRASLAGLSRILTGIEGVQDGVFLAPDDLDQNPAARLAAIAVAPAHTAASLTKALRAEIDPVFLPRPLLLLDALPRNELGKLPRAALLALLAPHDG
jgi:acyl-coenzyme A synthetase/AMP-(fatty) acid ligase